MIKAEKLNEQPSSGKKRLRQRKSNLYESIRKQMEFYFSTANLQKDRFLKKIVQTDPEGYVDVAAFLCFNKIKALTNDVTVIVKAVKESEMLTVDEKSARIRRKEKYVEPEDTDQRTVYVESLPKDATIDWLIGHFSAVDRVLHVSLPKYKSTGDIKGFAFVEFETAEGAAAACRQLSRPSESTDDTRPGIFAKTIKSGKHMRKPTVENAEGRCDVDSTGSGEAVEMKSNSASKSKKKKRHLSSEPSEEKSGKPEATGNESETRGSSEVQLEKTPEKKTSTKKRRRSSDCCDVRTPAKVLKLEEEEEHKKSSDCQKNPSPTKKKSKNKSTTKVDGNAVANVELDLSSSSEKKLKSSSFAGSKMIGRGALTCGGVASLGLRVISKREWLDYRQEYYQKHKQNLSDLKTKLKQIKEKQHLTNEKRQQLSEKETDGKNESGIPETAAAAAGAPEGKNEDGLAFVPDVIVKVTLKSPVSKKFLKERMSESGKVAFLDMTEGELTGHARCVDAASAEAILTTSKEECSYELLKDNEEKLYWDKVFSDREKRLSSKTKKKTRGRDRLLAKADKCMEEIKKKGTHIFFD